MREVVLVLGVNHVVMNVASAVVSIETICVLHKVTYTVSFFKQNEFIVNETWTNVLSYLCPYALFTQVFWIWFVGVLLLFLIGTLLPDIDSKKSLFGRIVHIPVKHRTWTHTIWFPVLIFVGSIWYSPLFYLGAGYILHLFWDSLSAGGVCYFYPISRYRTYGSNGAFVKCKHNVKLYHTGKSSEIVVVSVFLLITVVISAVTVFYLTQA